MINRFGNRYLRVNEFCAYAVDLDLFPQRPGAGFLEFLEAEGLLTPVRRIKLPPEIVRRLFKEEHSNEPVINPVEPDGQRLTAAADLMNTLNMHRWSNPTVFGETVHVLDAMEPEHAQFIQSDFPVASFKPWRDLRTHLCDRQNGNPLYSNNDQHAPAFYHYWQIFWLAALVRSGVHIYYPLDDDALGREVLSGKALDGLLKGKSFQSINIEAYHELRKLREFEQHFEAVGYYQAYAHNAFQICAQQRDANDRITAQAVRRYRKRESEIARDTLSRSGHTQDDMINFIRQQCRWWDNAARIGPAAVAEEYKSNISVSIDLIRAATGIEPDRIIDLVGRCTGHMQPTLKVIFPDWAEEQRDLTIRSLKGWASTDLATLPPPFPCSDTDLNDFCDWLEARGLYQYYWHFRRLVDIERRDDPVHRAASTAEVVGFASLCEMIANEVMIDRSKTPRGNTLFPKLRFVFGPHGPVDLTPLFDDFGKLANTKTQSMSQRLSQIARIKKGGAYSPVLRAMLSLMVIRNEGAHLGLLKFDHAKVIEMIRTLALASLIIWKAR